MILKPILAILMLTQLEKGRIKNCCLKYKKSLWKEGN